MTGISKVLGGLALVIIALPAGATTWSADEQNPASVQTVAACSGGTVACQYTLNDTSTSTNDVLKLRAYSNTGWTPSSSGGIAPVGSGAGVTYTTTGSNAIASTGWTAARNIYYSGENAFGISNNIQYASTEENNFPELGIDNTETLDLMVIELPQVAGEAWDLQSFMLGWAQENGVAGHADVSMFIGGSSLGANYDFSGVCIDSVLAPGLGSCTGSEKALSSLGGGFTNITAAIAGGGSNVNQLTDTAVTTNATGNYIIVAGALGQGDDSLKLKSITASLVPSKTPEPATLALLGLGLVGMGALRRRKAAA